MYPLHVSTKTRYTHIFAIKKYLSPTCIYKNEVQQNIFKKKLSVPYTYHVPLFFAKNWQVMLETNKLSETN